ncbi:MAG: iron complex transport system substrate-binding protein [Alphaproteobacteria bacterium]|nr:iron complex transport system substrate-binding protein [Alphaproteobacteria bacterium]
MRKLAAALLLLLSGMPAFGDSPRRVVSFNLCADQLVVALADSDQIAALSPYAQDRHLSIVAERARGFPTLDWSAEGTVAFGPDLVLVGPNDRRETRRMLNTLKIPVADVALVTDIAAARNQILTVAARLGHPERGDAMVRALDDARSRLAAAARPIAKTALVVERGGYVEGPQSLVATLLAEAGLRLPAGAPAGYGGYMSLEMLLVTRPDLLVLKDPPLQAEDQGALFFTHPAVAALYPADRRIALPTRYTLCGGPALIEALDYLADVLGRNAGPRNGRPLPGSERSRWRG